MLNGWWYSRLDLSRKSFDFVRVPIGLSWITRELQKISVRDIPFQWWSKPAAGFYKCHPWSANSYSRVYANNLVPLTTVTVGHESYPETVKNYLSAEPFAIRGSDPRPVVAVDLAESSDSTVVQLIEKRMDEASSLMQKELLKQAFFSGRLNIQDDIDRMAREEAARRADELFTMTPWQGNDADEDYEATALKPILRKRQKKQKPKPEPLDPLLATGRKFDL